MRIQRITAPILLALALGCASAQFSGLPSYAAQGLSIRVERIEYDDDQLQLTFLFVNNTERTMLVDRSQLMLVTPDGQSHSRSNAEVFGFATEATHTILPHTGHPVQVFYKIPEQTPQAVLKLDRAVTVNGTPVALPDYMITNVTPK